jgi:predicted aspartyl protease
LSRKITANVWLVAGGQIKTFVLSTAIKINKELQTSMTHSPARLPQAVVGSCGIIETGFKLVKRFGFKNEKNVHKFQSSFFWNNCSIPVT